MNKTFYIERYAKLVVGDGLSKPSYLCRVVNGKREFLKGVLDADVHGGSTDIVLEFNDLPDGCYEARSYNPRSYNSFMLWWVVENGQSRKAERDEVFAKEVA